MYYIHTIEDTISIPPKYFGQDLEKTATEVLRAKYERTMDKDLGIILAVYNVRDVSDGHIMPGDPSTHHDLKFDVLSFYLGIDEVVVGEISELADFGCFVRLGPLDGLVHLSQITSDFITYDKKATAFVSKNSGKSLKKGDKVYAKVSSISARTNIKDAKIALTMRPDGLGRPEWLREPKRERGAPGDRRGGGRPRPRGGAGRK
ncbi:MAG: DNA-directed RNA polymerase [Candidatus Micrarchaeota archaeon]|nr:DNA-directed RNA polymerase [Candidatus Micrarchaeota archaeon]MDE1859331.1 DNA-directed RNA polymerase [Candidatus Micrarchaeota archaeon]